MAYNKKQDNAKEDGSRQGYWMYEDGSSYYGVGIMRNGEIPMNIPEEVHKTVVEDEPIVWKSVEEKLAWRKEEVARLATADAEAE
jgi:hypothetical protein